MKHLVGLASFALTSLIAAGCTPDDCNSIEPAYAGEATDETWRVMLDARADAEETSDVEVTEPEDGAEFNVGGDVPVIAWDSSLEVAMLPTSPSLPSFPAHRRRHDLFDRVSEAVFPVAHAHQPPITSDLYFVEIDVPDRKCAVAALTTLQSLILADGDWEEVTKGTGEHTLRILSAFVTENRITEGPYAAKPLTFSVTP